MAIAVFYGGKSCEHAVSIVTGVQTMHLIENAIPVYIDRNGKWLVPKKWSDISAYRDEIKGKRALIKFGEPYLYYGTKKVKLDTAVICCHGAFGEDGCLQGILQSCGIPYTGSGVSASAIGLDKRLSKRAFAWAGLDVLPYAEVKKDEYKNSLYKLVKRLGKIGYPLIVKPASCGSSIGIKVAKTTKELIFALSVAFEWDNSVVVEKALVDFTEYNCGVIVGKKVRVSEVERPTKIDEILSFADKYERGGLSGKGGREFPAKISDELKKEIQQKAVVASEAIGASGVLRVDFLYDEREKKLFVNEVNTLPGSLALYLFDDKKQTLNELIEIAKEEEYHRNKRKFLYSGNANHGK